MEQKPKQQTVERLKQATNIVVTTNTAPSVDEAVSVIALTLMLQRLGKRATAIVTNTPSTSLEFLPSSRLLSSSTDSLRDFIMVLDKSKADKLRYKVEDGEVRIFITPYKTTLSNKDVTFRQGDFNVDLVVGIGVTNRSSIDKSVLNQDQIINQTDIVTLNSGEKSSQIGLVNWSEPTASSISEMLVSISEALESNMLDEEISMPLLTGIISATDRFSNEHTSPKVMTMAAQLMAAGAHQQDIVSNLQKVAKQPEPKEEPAKKPEKTDEEKPQLPVELPVELPKPQDELKVQDKPEQSEQPDELSVDIRPEEKEDTKTQQPLSNQAEDTPKNEEEPKENAAQSDEKPSKRSRLIAATADSENSEKPVSHHTIEDILAKSSSTLELEKANTHAQEDKIINTKGKNVTPPTVKPLVNTTQSPPTAPQVAASTPKAAPPVPPTPPAIPSAPAQKAPAQAAPSAPPTPPSPQVAPTPSSPASVAQPSNPQFTPKPSATNAKADLDAARQAVEQAVAGQSPEQIMEDPNKAFAKSPNPALPQV